MTKTSLSAMKIFLFVLLASNLYIDAECHVETRGILGGFLGGVAEKVGNATAAVVNTIRAVENMVSELGGKMSDLVERSKADIPGLADGLLSVFDDDGNRVPLLVDLPEVLDLDKPVEDMVQFILYNDRNKEGEFLPFADANALRRSSFDPRQDTVFVTHGWRNSNRSRAAIQPRDAFLRKGGFNVIVVDWAPIANDLYVLSANMVPKVAKHVAEMMNFLDSRGVLTRRTRMVGHSLGAHVVGLAGLNAKVKPYYVTGLDPALPLFTLAQPGARISPESGESVEIIHSNAGLLGYMARLGHADFYPNGGQQQVGCMIADVACSHSRSHEIYAASLINEPRFYARKCIEPLVPVPLPFTSLTCKGTQGLMGTLRERLTNENRGAFYLETTGTPPYF